MLSLPKMDRLMKCADASFNATLGTTFKTLYELPDGPARNFQARYNIAPTDPVECRQDHGRRSARDGLDALGPHSMVVEKAAEANAGKLQRACRERCRQADVPRRVQAPS